METVIISLMVRQWMSEETQTTTLNFEHHLPMLSQQWCSVEGQQNREVTIKVRLNTQAILFPRGRIVSLWAWGAKIGLKVVRRPYPSTQPNRQVNQNCIGIFITKIGGKTTANQMYRHVLMHTSLKVRPEKLSMKYDNYCSFLVQCPSHVHSTLLDADFEPGGSRLKSFYT